MGRRVAMAIETPGHVERLGLVNFVHFIDLAMALDATDAAVHMDGMIEIDVVWQFVNLDPGDRLAGLVAVANQSQLGVVFEHLIVAIHAQRAGRDVGIPGFLDGVVAITAVNAQLVRVNCMGKRHRLHGHVAHIGVFVGEIIPDPGRHGRANQ